MISDAKKVYFCSFKNFWDYYNYKGGHMVLQRKSLTFCAFLQAEKNAAIVYIISIITGLILSCFNAWHSWINEHGINETIVHYFFPFFFFRVTLEALREVRTKGGHLSGNSLIQCMLMAIGGVSIPIVVTAIFYPEKLTPENGMFIAVATDIAFVVLASSVTNMSEKLRKTLLAIAILDDMIGIGIIAWQFEVWELEKFIFLGSIIFIVILSKIFEQQCDKIKNPIYWFLVGGVLIYLFHHFNIHTSLAGVVAACLVPYKQAAERLGIAEKAGQQLIINPKISAYHWLEEVGLMVICTTLIVPSFIVAHTLIPFHAINLSVFNQKAFAIANGLFLGKTIGIFGIAMITSRWYGLPANSKLELLGGAMLCGIGFTVSLFFAGMSKGINTIVAFVGISIGSISSAICGILTINYANNLKNT